ncbi:mapk-regulated corepressor-interacting protein 1 isoform X3 [Scyliorhinus canicula]|uniref:mapk-regulated corepressor-interacting protein 1 isoform X3 n=1 Tax=Scyliorhinus canicula TaxID=7830 RepID=UPI0018F3B794|nr:mapk-regulated corepressor-interacting protein 1 isoform X3 [Scyliorhinus canicula]
MLALGVRSSPAPRIVYNGKRNNGPRSPTNTAPQESYTPAHEENVRFIHEAWQCVERELRSQMSGNERGPVQYVEKNPNPNLHSFLIYSRHLRCNLLLLHLLISHPST